MWWIELGYPPFEQGKGGFPSVGQVIRHYREQRRDHEGRVWAQKDLARYLRITEQAIRDIENRDIRMDYERRHVLCPLLDIPPLLLGIVTLKEIEMRVEQGQAAKPVAPSREHEQRDWWVESGYPAFAPGKDGFPRPGAVVKYYRERKMDHKGHPYTQQYLAQILGITDQAVRDLENKDAGMDFDRRQFLSKWLAIPPILLGVVTLDQIRQMGAERGIALTREPSQHIFVSGAVSTGYKLTLDPIEYREKLVSYWKTDNSRTAYGTLADTLRRTSAIYQELPHVKPMERYQLYELLCGYHQFMANLLRDKQKYKNAIIHLNKAFHMAELLRNAELEALVLYSRGYIFCSTDCMNEALRDFNTAKQYENKLPGYLSGPVRMYTGVVRAKTAETEQEKKEAILLLDSGGKIVRAHRRQESPYFIDFGLDRYHLDKSTALIAVGQNESAMEELKLVKGGFQNVRKQAYNDILQAQAHINVGNYAEAASLAEIALLAVQEIDSISYVARVEKIYQQLQDGPYKNSPDVGHLDYLLHYKPGKQ